MSGPAVRVAVRVGVAAALLLPAACGDGTEPAAFAASGAWARPTPAAATEGVVYLIVTSDVADELVGAAVPASVAGHADLHTSNAAADGGHHHGAADDGGEVTMEHVDAVPIEAGGTVTFSPGGNHIMLVDLAAPLAEGDRFEMTLRFSSGRSLVVPVVVSVNPPD